MKYDIEFDDFRFAHEKFFSMTKEQVAKSIKKIFERYDLKVDLKLSALDNRTGYFVRNIIAQNFYKLEKLTPKQIETLTKIIHEFS